MLDRIIHTYVALSRWINEQGTVYDLLTALLVTPFKGSSFKHAILVILRL